MSQISADQYNMWIAYSQLHPFGSYRQDIRTGAVVAAIYNLITTIKGLFKRQNTRPLTPEQGAGMIHAALSRVMPRSGDSGSEDDGSQATVSYNRGGLRRMNINDWKLFKAQIKVMGGGPPKPQNND